jgi:hypothetical protein
MATGSFAVEAVVKRPLSSTAPIKRAIVAHLRKSAALKAALVGGIHEGFAPEKADLPFLTYQLIYAPIRRDWGSQQYISGFDLRVFSGESVEANNIDTLVLTVLDDAALDVDGQSTLLCHRVADFASPDVDEEGRKIYMVGSTYEVWTDQPH